MHEMICNPSEVERCRTSRMAPWVSCKQVDLSS